MAMRAADRGIPKGTKSTQSRARKKTQPKTGITSRIGDRASDIGARMPALPVVNREFVGVISALAGLVTTWAALAGSANGVLVQAVAEGLEWLVGRATYVVPVILFGLAWRCFRSRDQSVLRWTHLVGAIGFAAATTGLTQAATLLAGKGEGGKVGQLVERAVSSLVGEAGTGVALLLIGASSVLLATSVKPVDLYRELKRIANIVYKPLPPIEETGLFDVIPTAADDALPLESSAVAEPPRVVINAPKRRPSPRHPPVTSR